MASPPSYSEANRVPATQLDFSQAMTDFKIMFPDMDSEVIEAVLRSNSGSVDLTIDHLLTMSVDAEAQKVVARPPSPPPPHKETSEQRKEPEALARPLDMKAGDVATILRAGGSRHGGGGDGTTLPPPTYFQATQTGDLINLEDGAADETPAAPLAAAAPTAVVDLLSDLDLNALSSSNPTLAYSHPERREAEGAFPTSPPPILPTQQQLQVVYEENLRLREAAASAETTANSQLLEDERIAVMLQNEEFMAELRRDHEFMSALEMDAPPPCAAVSRTTKAAPAPPPLSKPMDEAVFREKLKDMGKTSKRKFAQMASIFSSRRKGAARQLLGGHPTPSHDNLNAEPLINEDSDGDDGNAAAAAAAAATGKTPTKGKYTSFH